MTTFFKQIFRQLKTDKINTAISIFSLVIGLGVIGSATYFATQEISYNSQFSNGDRIYRVLNDNTDDRQTWGNTPFILGETIKENFAEVENIFHLYTISNPVIKLQNEEIKEDKIISTESDFFHILNIKIIEGSLQNFDENDNSIVIDASTARKYFGTTHNIIGQSIYIETGNNKTEMSIVAVYNDIPTNSSFYAPIITNISTGIIHLLSNIISNGVPPDVKMIKENWTGVFYTNFLLLKKDIDIVAFEEKLCALGKEHTITQQSFNLALQPLSDIYFHSQKIIDNNANSIGNLSLLWIIISVGIMILLISWSNYINLAISQSLYNMKSRAIHLICGSPKTIIFFHSVVKAMVIILISFPFALFLSKQGINLINKFSDSVFVFKWDKNLIYTLVIAIIISCLSGVLSGSIIALKMNKLSVIHSLKGKIQVSKQRTMKTLIIFQLTIFIALFTSMLLVEKQVNYIFAKDLGFKKEGLLCVSMNGNNSDLFKQEILKNANIVNAAGTMWMPPTNNMMHMTIPRLDNPDQKSSLLALFVDYDFTETMGIEITQGSSFNKEKLINGVLISQSAIKELGLTSVIGEQTAMGKVIGVFRDFNMGSLHLKLQPTIISLNKNMCGYMAIRMKTDDIQSNLKFLENTWENCGFNTPFNFTFTNDILNKLYKSDLNFSELIRVLTSIAILLSIIGLIGLSLLLGKQKIKEIGIRKVNGAKTTELVMMINKNFLKSTLIAFIISIPISWLTIKQWLENFAYKTTVSWWIFVISGFFAIIIVFVAVSWQSWRASNLNPVEALRNE